MRNKKVKSADLEAVRLMAALRASIGAVLIVAPSLSARIWMAERAATSATRASLRSLGAREIALGFGTLMAVENGERVGGWLQAGVISDSADALNALMFMDEVNPLLRLVWIAAPGLAAWHGMRLSAELGHSG